MKYFMGFALAISVIVNLIYMNAYQEYSLVIENGKNQRYMILFKSYTEPEFVNDRLRTDTVNGMITTYMNWKFTTNDSLHPWEFYYKTKGK